MMRLAALVLLFCVPSAGGILPPDRLTAWNPGVPGGIPHRTTVYTTLNAATYGNGASSATAGIQAALNACPVGQVVQLSAGRFTINAKASGEATPDDPPSVTVADRITGHTVFEACLMQSRKIRITVGHLYTHKGELVTVSPHYCRIGTGLTLFGDVAESRGSAATIG